MVLPAAVGGALAGVVLGNIAFETLKVVGRLFAVAWAHSLAAGMLEDFTKPDKVIKKIVPKHLKETYEKAAPTTKELIAIEDFLSFLQEFNKKFADFTIAASIIGPEASFAASQIASVYQWSYGLGWLSWIGTGQLLQNLIATPAEQALNKIMRHKLLTESAAKELWTLGLISDKELYEHLASLGYDDKKIEAIKKALIDDLTTGKVARMLRLGIVSEKTVLEKLKDLGVPEDLAVLAIKRMYNLPSDSVIIKLYKAGRIDRETALRMLKLNGYDNLSAEMVLEAALIDRTEEDKALSKSDVMRLRRFGLIDDSEFIQFMKALGYDELEADYLLKLTKAMIPVEEAPKPKTLTKDNILTAFGLGVINENEARRMLKALGYDSSSIDVLIALANAKKVKEPEMLRRELTKSDVLKAFRMGIISRDEAEAFLTKLGYTEQEKEILLKLADIKEAEREVRRFLSASIVARAFREERLDEATFEEYLRNLGYGDFEISVFKALYKPKAS